MEKVRGIFRLALQCGISNRKIGRICGISHSMVRDYLKRANHGCLEYEKIKEMDDTALRAAL